MRTVIAAALLAVVAQAQDEDARSPAAIAALVEKLGADDFVERETAALRLIEIGEPALGPVRPLLRSDDSEVRARARQVIAGIETALRSAALRLSATADKKSYGPREVPRIEIRATNIEDFAVVAMKWNGVIGTSVGSELTFEGVRVRLSADPVGTGSVTVRRVGMMQEQQMLMTEVRVSPDAFVALKPGESIPVTSVQVHGTFTEAVHQALKPGKYRLKVVFELSTSWKDEALQGRCKLHDNEVGVVFDGNAGVLLKVCWTGRIEAEADFEVTGEQR